jgi:hypothetical protein
VTIAALMVITKLVDYENVDHTDDKFVPLIDLPMNQIVMDDLTKKMDAHQKHKLEKIF